MLLICRADTSLISAVAARFGAPCRCRATPRFSLPAAYYAAAGYAVIIDAAFRLRFYYFTPLRCLFSRRAVRLMAAVNSLPSHVVSRRHYCRCHAAAAADTMLRCRC